MGWTEQKVARASELAGQNYTCTQIAEELSKEFSESITKNAVVGKLSRLGVPIGEHGISIPRRERKKIVRTPPGVTQGIKARLLASKEPKLKTEPLPVLPKPHNFLGVPFIDLQIDMCRYPQGDGPFFFCGQPQVRGSSYCEHCKVICEPVRPKFYDLTDEERDRRRLRWMAIGSKKRRAA